jgi:cell wall-associated NlpC family hydrolase
MNDNASSWIGIPYSTRDCYALVLDAAEDLFGLHYPSIADYVQNPTKAITDALAVDWRWHRIDVPQEGCIVLLGTNGHARHVGLYLGEDQVLHAHRKVGSCIQDMRALGLLYSLEGYYIWAQ